MRKLTECARSGYPPLGTIEEHNHQTPMLRSVLLTLSLLPSVVLAQHRFDEKVPAPYEPAQLTTLAPQLRQDSFEAAFSEVKGYCMSGVCLGSRMDEVTKLGELSWEGLASSRPTGHIDCSASPMNFVYLILADGTKLTLNFAQVKTTGPVDTRYRVQRISVPLPKANKVQREALLQQMVDRFAPMRHVPSAAFTLWLRDLPSMNSSVSVVLLEADEAAPERAHQALNSISIDVRYKHVKRWLATQKECMSGAPKL